MQMFVIFVFVIQVQQISHPSNSRFGVVKQMECSYFLFHFTIHLQMGKKRLVVHLKRFLPNFLRGVFMEYLV